MTNHEGACLGWWLLLAAILVAAYIVKLTVELAPRPNKLRLDGWARLAIVAAIWWGAVGYELTDYNDDLGHRVYGTIGILLMPIVGRWIINGFKQRKE